VAETLFRSEADDHFRIGVEPHAIPFEVLAGHLASKIDDTARRTISVVLRVPSRLGQLVDHQRIGRIGGIAHAQVEHVVTGPALFVQQVIDPPEHVGRQPDHARGQSDLEGICLPGDRRFGWRIFCRVARRTTHLL